MFSVAPVGLPMFEARVLRNCVAAMAGAGIVLDAPAAAMEGLSLNRIARLGIQRPSR
jgi:hypothetical protein